jgi:hypothetical protein
MVWFGISGRIDKTKCGVSRHPSQILYHQTSYQASSNTTIIDACAAVRLLWSHATPWAKRAKPQTQIMCSFLHADQSSSSSFTVTSRLWTAHWLYASPKCTTSGTYRRPITKLALLDVVDDEPIRPSSGGEKNLPENQMLWKWWPARVCK